MTVRQNISFKERLISTGIGLAICLAAMPVAVVATIVLMPLWSWLEKTLSIEAVGHSGPAEWCYLFVYIVVISSAGFLWSRIRRQREQAKR